MIQILKSLPMVVIVTGLVICVSFQVSFASSKKSQKIIDSIEAQRGEFDDDICAAVIDIQSYVPDREVGQRLASEILAGKYTLEEAAQAGVDRIKAMKFNPEDVYDFIIVGASVAELATQMAIRKTHKKKPKVLTLEASQDIIATFRKLGIFYLNSSSKPPQDTLFQFPGGRTGDLNRIPSAPLQPADVLSRKFPVAKEFGDVAAINRGLFSDMPIEFGAKVSMIGEKEIDGESIIEVKLSNGQVRKARRVILATGFGEERKLFGSEDLFEKVDEQGVPLLQTGYQAAGRAANSLNPISPYSNKEIAYVGAGDAAKTFLPYHARLGPEQSYGNDPVSVAPPESFTWYGQSCLTCEEFTAENRARYSEVGGLIKSGFVKPVPEKAITFIPSKDGTKIIAVSRKENSDFSPLGPGTQNLDFREFDLGIQGVGFKSTLGTLLRSAAYEATDDELKRTEELNKFYGEAMQIYKVMEDLRLVPFYSGPGRFVDTDEYTINFTSFNPDYRSLFAKLMNRLKTQRSIKIPIKMKNTFAGTVSNLEKVGLNIIDQFSIGQLFDQGQFSRVSALELREAIVEKYGKDTFVEISVGINGLSKKDLRSTSYSVSNLYSFSVRLFPENGSPIELLNQGGERYIGPYKFQNDVVGKILRDAVNFYYPFQSEVKSDVVLDDTENDRRVKVARNLDNEIIGSRTPFPPRIVSVGTAALESGDLASEEEKVGVAQNGVSMFLLLPRTYLYMQEALKSLGYF